MSLNDQPEVRDYPDPLIDEIRTIRREICRQAGYDVDRLCDQLVEVERQHRAREGVFANCTPQAAQKVLESWGAEAWGTDDPLIDEVRAIRRSLRPQSEE